jgi:hypothetical protein
MCYQSDSELDVLMSQAINIDPLVMKQESNSLTTNASRQLRASNVTGAGAR